jgi:integrase
VGGGSLLCRTQAPDEFWHFSTEVIGMRWSEVDLENKVWTIPAKRTKQHREHRVPLSDRVVELLAQQRKVSAGEYVWQKSKRPITGKPVYLYLTKTMKVPVTLHGFRTSFRIWAEKKARLPGANLRESNPHTDTEIEP